jgi:hypothetical protein
MLFALAVFFDHVEGFFLSELNSHFVSHADETFSSHFALGIGALIVDAFHGLLGEGLAGLVGGHIFDVLGDFGLIDEAFLSHEALDEFVLLVQHSLFVVLFGYGGDVGDGELVGVLIGEVVDQLV